MNTPERIKIERRLIRFMIRVLKRNGWEIAFIDDGGENVRVSSVNEALEVVFGVDDCRIFFKKGLSRHWVLIVLGNDGWDAVADYSYSEKVDDGFEGIMVEVSKYSDYLCDENQG